LLAGAPGLSRTPLSQRLPPDESTEPARERRYGRVVDVFVGYVATGMLYGPAARRFMTGDGGGSRDRQADSAQASVPPSSEFWRGWRSWCRHRRRRPRAAASKGRPSRVCTMS